MLQGWLRDEYLGLGCTGSTFTPNALHWESVTAGMYLDASHTGYNNEPNNLSLNYN